MNIHRLLITCACLLAAGASHANHHQGGVLDGWTQVPTANCADIDFADVVISRFPEITEACRAVVRDADGKPYVVIEAKVHYVRRDIRSRSVQNVTLDMLDANGMVLRKLGVRPPRGFRFTVDGKQYTADYLTRNAELTLYLPPDRWEVVWSPESATPIDTQVFIEDVQTYLVTSNLKADDIFEFDSADLSDIGRSDLDAILALSDDYVPSITIIGHSDRIGGEKYNLDLSTRRANAAKDYLVTQGVPPWRITAEGKGTANPIVTCEDVADEALKDCLAPNRRAEVAFLVPAIADAATVEVTKTYVKPLGEIVTIREEKRVTQLSEISLETETLLEACSAEVENVCSGVKPGTGRVVGCLLANRRPDYNVVSPGCDDALAGALEGVLSGRGRLNAVGDACGAELAACEASPAGGKLECVAQGSRSAACANAMSNLAGARS